MFKVFCGISAFFILWVITIGCSSLKYLTTWTLLVQFFYFLSEFHHNKHLSIWFQNLVWTPSLFLLVYWPISYHYNWYVNNYNLFHDIFMHAVNVLLIVIAVYMSPKLEYKYMFIPLIFGLSYLTFAVLYTNNVDKIYPTDFFGVNINIVIDIAVVLVAVPLIHSAGVITTKRIKKVKVENDENYILLL